MEHVEAERIVDVVTQIGLIYDDLPLAGGIFTCGLLGPVAAPRQRYRQAAEQEENFYKIFYVSIL